MAFTDVAWTNGDTITETKLDQMVANEQHVREELNSRVLVTAPHYLEGTPASLTLGANVKWYADSTLLDTINIAGGWTDYSSVNKAIGALSVGLHSLHVAIFRGSAENDRVSFRLERVSDLAYASLWLRARTVEIASGYYVEIKGLTILGHRTSKSW